MFGSYFPILESIAGDITPHDGISKEEKAKLEDDAMLHIRKVLEATHSPSVAAEMYALFREYEEHQTEESKAMHGAPSTYFPSLVTHVVLYCVVLLSPSRHRQV